MLNIKLLWRLTRGLTICVALFLSAIVHGQERLPSLPISLEVSNMPFQEVLHLISEKSGLQFSYSSKKIPVDQKVTYQAKKSIEEILDDLMVITDLMYELVEKQIVIRPVDNRKENDEQTLYGYVKDKTNGEVLIGATIFVEEQRIGTITNTSGFYSITIARKDQHVAFAYIGYQGVKVSILGESNGVLDIALEPKLSVLSEVLVSARSANISELTTAKSFLTPKTIGESPALLGEGDVVKSLAFVPGVKSHAEGSNFYYVRGGNRDQNLLLIDGAPIYNPSHLFGIFSTVIPDAVNNIDVYKGDMPASFGGRLSSVIDVHTKKGNMKGFEAWGNTTLLSTRLGAEGPIKTEKSSYLVSSRFSHIRWFFDQDVDDLEQLNFLDFTAKLNFDINKNNKVCFSTYIGGDNYFGTNDGIQWSNTAATLRWNRILNNRLFLNSTLSGSAYTYFLHTDIENNTKWKSYVGNINLKTDFTYFLDPKNTFMFGVGLTGHNFNPGNLTSDNTNVQPPLVSIKNAAEVVLYGDLETRPTDKLKLRAGLRISSWDNIGGAFEFLFDENHQVGDTLFFDKDEKYHTYANIEPRIEVQFDLDENRSLRTSFNKNVQNVHLISNSISPFTSLEVWVPSSINIKPQIAHQVVFEYAQYLPKRGLNLSIELFYKEMENQIAYEAHAETLLNSIFESELRFGSAKAYGLEAMVRKQQGKTRGWIGYSYARAKHQFDEVNDGQTFNAFYDRPHEANIVLAHDLTSRWSIGVNWTYSTGSNFSSPTSFFKYNGLETPIYGEKNNERLPDYHRLDLSASIKLNKSTSKRFQHKLSLSIFNAYGRKNTLFINYNKVESENGDFKIPSNILENNRLITQSYLFQFTPAISYSFRLK